MNTEKKSTLINIVALIIMIASVVFMSFGLIKGFLTSSQANIVIGTGLALFWLLSDIVEPFACDRMKDTTLTRKEAYVKYIALDLIGYAGVMYFLMGVGANGQSGGILGAVVFIVTMKPKKNQREIFLGLVTEDEDDEEQDAEEAAIEGTDTEVSDITATDAEEDK